MAESQTHGTISLSSQAEVAQRIAHRLATSPLREIVSALGADAELTLVGGSVRDAFLGHTTGDGDFATKLAAADCLARLQKSGIHCLEVGAKHGTIVAIVDQKQIEISTFRLARGDGSVEYGATLESDLAARDFTINAIAFKANGSEFFDPTNGIQDLTNGILRTVGSASLRFQEDPLRILRMVRFGPGQGRAVESTTREAAIQLKTKLQSVSVERIRAELEKILLSPFPRNAFEFMRDAGLLEVILPEMLPSIGLEQNKFHIEDVFQHTLSVIERARPERIMRWIALFHDLGKPATLSIGEDGERHFYSHEKVSETLAKQAMERLKFSHNDTNTISTVVRQHMRPVSCGEAGVRRILRDLGDHYALWREFKVADAPPIMADDAVQAELQNFDLMVETERKRPKGSVFAALAVDGADLIKMGMKPGPQMGKMIKMLHELVLDNPDLNEKEILLERAKALSQAEP